MDYGYAEFDELVESREDAVQDFYSMLPKAEKELIMSRSPEGGKRV